MMKCLRGRFTKRTLQKCRNLNYSVVGLDEVTDELQIPTHIPKPPYYKNGVPSPRNSTIESVQQFHISVDFKSEEQMKRLREAGHVAGGILDKTLDYAEVGMTTDELDKFAHDLILKKLAYPAPFNYRGFPKSICTSVNNVLCHGIPNKRVLEEGDILSVDVSVYLNGVFGDCCSNRIVGKGDGTAVDLIATSRDCVLDSIKYCRHGASFNVIGQCISDMAERKGYSVCKEFVGHGIGEYFHGMPHVYHYNNTFGPIMLKDMVFTIEPILMEGRDGIKILADGWTAVTADNSRAAQFEHTVVITEDGAEIISPHR